MRPSAFLAVSAFLAFYYLYCFANTLQRLLMHFSYHTRTKKKTDELWCIFAKKKFVVLAFDSNVTSDDVKNDGFLKTSDHQ